MNQEIVSDLEQRIEESVAEAIANMGRDRLPLLLRASELIDGQLVGMIAGVLR